MLFSIGMFAQIQAPVIRCISVSSPSFAIISWDAPVDPSHVFNQYQVWSSSTQLGTYNLVGTISNYTQTVFTHSASNASSQSQYYYISTISNGTMTSVPSDTVRSIYLNLSNAFNGIANLNWNAMRSPLSATSALTYTLSREYPIGTWSVIYSGTKQSYKDTIYLCNAYYNYKVEISDSYGCISKSNVIGDNFQNIQSPHTLVLDSVSVNANGLSVLGWPPAASLDVNRYIIYSVSAGNFLTALDTIYGYNNTSYTYTGSTANSGSEAYCIAAIDSCGNYSIPSIPHNSIFLNAPVYDLCSRTASLTWTAYSNLPKGVLKYDVYCSINGGVFNNIGSSVNTNYSHAHLNPTDSYCYFVKVRNSDISISANSNKQCFVATGLPGPSYVYINSVSVNTANKQIEVSFTVDNTNPYKGCTIFKSLDGVNYTRLAYVSSSVVMPQTYVDTDVITSEKKYYYKIQAADDCNNPGVWSDTSKSIVLHVSNDTKNIFYNTLTWDDYTKWGGGVASFNIYRAINGVFDPKPINNVPVGTKTYVDNVENFVSDQGKFSYYVEAIEGSGNVHGFMDKAKSNPADAYVEASIFVPNAFSPKGINAVWLPMSQYVEKTDYKVMVFNRWGDKIFETHSDMEGWTGNGATDDVYVYMIEYKNARGEFIQLKGHVNIIR